MCFKLGGSGILLAVLFVPVKHVASNLGYHYLGSAKIIHKMGMAFGEGMIELLAP